jgi:hypothetical protein
VRDPPLTLRLPFHLVRQGFSLPRLLAADPDRPWSEGYALLEQLALSGPERDFALGLLRGKTNLWLYRCNQRRFCGDFVTIDMSPPRAADRRARVIELKQGAPLGTDAGGVQLVNHRDALDEIAAREGVIAPGCPAELLRGDPAAVLGLLRRRRR